MREPEENIADSIMPNKATDRASSIPAMAMIRVGMPLATPYPFDLSLEATLNPIWQLHEYTETTTIFYLKRQATVTAGETADIMEPRAVL